MTITATEWNARYPIGTLVRYYPIIGEDKCIKSKTRSEAWELGHGAPVVLIDGSAGGKLLKAIEVVES
ncbi:MAG: hypothetical protein LBE24_10530 [Methylobacillus sp.]|jgi:hypothetical protein|nr:hypothetical protein [Methylobacillus sp.]